MKVLVTGRRGQLVQCLMERCRSWPGHEIVALGVPELDLAAPGSALGAVQSVRPDLVVNAAAYTAVDRAEQEPELAFRVNAAGAEEVARAAREAGAPIIQISTDYVFGGSGTGAYREGDTPEPITVYGRSKLEGEERVRQANPNHLILRTSWVYSPFGSNFVKTMLRLAADRDEVAVVADQIGSPTSGFDLADAIGAVLKETDRGGGWGETFHVCGTGATTWADFAREIFAQSSQLGGPAAKVRDLATSEWPSAASRPANSKLDSSKFEQRFGFVMPDWRVSLRPVVARLLVDLS